MSIVTVQIGQCGNQIGEKLFETIVSDCYDTPSNWSKRALDVQKQLKSLNPEYLSESKERFFYENDFESSEFSKNSSNESNPQHVARSILIDMENKVVNKLLNKPSDPNFNWMFSQHNSYTRKKGSGNNC